MIDEIEPDCTCYIGKNSISYFEFVAFSCESLIAVDDDTETTRINNIDKNPGLNYSLTN